MSFPKLFSILLISLFTTAAFANPGYVRMVCYGLDIRGDLDSRNSYAILVQQIDNSVMGPGAFVPGHENFDADALITTDFDGSIKFAAKVFVDASSVDTDLPPEQYAEELLKLNADYFRSDLLAERLAENFVIYEAKNNEFTVDSDWSEDKISGDTDVYTNLLSKPQHFARMSLECMKPFIVDSPSIEPAAETDETTTAMKK